jgi:hypothetical protein
MPLVIQFLAAHVTPRVILAADPPFDTSTDDSYTYTARRVVAVATGFVDCTFPDCKTTGASNPDNFGGVISLTTALDLGFASCFFADSPTSLSGGAISAGMSVAFSITETTGLNCCADGCSFCPTTADR